MTFEHTWTTDPTAAAAAGGPGDHNNNDDAAAAAFAASAPPPLDLSAAGGFSFDPSLIESLPDHIPDFFLAFGDPQSLLQPLQPLHSHEDPFGTGHQLQQHSSSLSPFQGSATPAAAAGGGGGGGTHVTSPSAGGSSSTTRPHHHQNIHAEPTTAAPSSASSSATAHTQNHLSGPGRNSLVLLTSPRPTPATNSGSVSASASAVAEDPDIVLKRQRNTIAARKYRQKRLDRIKELEDALAAMTKERDSLRLQLARQEAETAALKEMMQMGKGRE